MNSPLILDHVYAHEARRTWSMEAGTLTPTMKIKRSRIEAAVAHAVDGWYATGAPVVWA